MNQKSRRILTLSLVLMIMFTGIADFRRWLSDVESLNAPENPKADAIVALTGGSGLRIKKAISLLDAEAGEILLVSGVNKSIDAHALIKNAGGTEAAFDCCIHIGHQAVSTEGNARETQAWAKQHGVQKIILVTSDYHIPRTLVWFKHEAADLEIVPYPMESQLKPEDWWKSWKNFRGLVTEWAKYRVTAIMLAL